MWVLPHLSASHRFALFRHEKLSIHRNPYKPSHDFVCTRVVRVTSPLLFHRGSSLRDRISTALCRWFSEFDHHGCRAVRSKNKGKGMGIFSKMFRLFCGLCKNVRFRTCTVCAVSRVCVRGVCVLTSVVCYATACLTNDKKLREQKAPVKISRIKLRRQKLPLKAALF